MKTLEEKRQTKRTYMRRWRLSNLDSSRQHCRRAVEKQRFGVDVQKLLAKFDNECLFCGMSNEEHSRKYNRRLTIDHIDGNGRNSDTPNNHLSNLQVLCLPCHGRKDRKRVGVGKALANYAT